MSKKAATKAIKKVATKPVKKTAAKAAKKPAKTAEKPAVKVAVKTVEKTAVKVAKKPAKKAAKPIAKEIAEWTILVYMAGDNDLDSFGGKDLMEMKKIGSTDKVHVVVQRDSAVDGAHRYYMTKGTQLKQDEIGALGVTNTGDPAVLESFLTWGLATYPAKRTMAVLWNHGNGWDDTDIYAVAKERGLKPLQGATGGTRRSGGGSGNGFSVSRTVKAPRHRGSFFITAFDTIEVGGERRAIAFDDGAQDFLDSVEIKKVFASVANKTKKKFDVIGMDACLMSMVENGLQVQGSGDVFCGSQEVEPGDGWPYDRILKALTAKPTMAGRQLCSLIVEEFVKSYSKDVAVTQSAFDLSTLTEVRNSANALGELLLQALSNPEDLAVEGAISRARKQSQKYEHVDYVDLWDFTAKLAALWPGAAKAASAVQQSIGNCVFANQAPHVNVGQSHGLSIYLPVEKVHRLYATLDIADGGWAKFSYCLQGLTLSGNANRTVKAPFFEFA